MKIEENRIVTMSYELRDQKPEGELLEVVDIAYPFIFFYKSEGILDTFQEQLRGLQRGDVFDFILPCEEAYGEKKSSEIVKVPIERFVIDQEMGENIQEVGQYVAITQEDGKQYNGIVIEKNPMYLTVDLNHAMAGKDLHFKGRILNVRNATTDELVEKRYIMPDGIRFG